MTVAGASADARPVADGVRRPLRAVVCGSRFGRTYMAALGATGAGLRSDRPLVRGVELVGLLARGSDRSRRCAEHYGVPLYRDVAHLPADVDLACVVVGSELNGGRGAQLSQELLSAGIHVVQEHPLSERELAACLRAARAAERVFRLNTHYTDVEPVRVMLSAARALRAHQPPLYADACCSIIVLGPVLEIIATALGRLRPWRFEEPRRCGPFTVVCGELAGVPLSLRIQNELHPANRDSFAHTLGRVTLGTAGGNLLLTELHGPVHWYPRAHMPEAIEDAVTLDGVDDRLLELVTARTLAGAQPSRLGAVVGDLWPRATARVLAEVRDQIITGKGDPARDQRQLALCRITAELVRALGHPRLLDDPPPPVLEADEIITALPGAGSHHPTKEPIDAS